MFSNNTIKNHILYFLNIVAVLSLSCCSTFRGTSQTEDMAQFDYHPHNYWQAKATKDISIPKYVAKNISQTPIYPIPLEKSLNGELQMTKVPPTLMGKIADYD